MGRPAQTHLYIVTNHPVRQMLSLFWRRMSRCPVRMSAASCRNLTITKRIPKHRASVVECGGGDAAFRAAHPTTPAVTTKHSRPPPFPNPLGIESFSPAVGLSLPAVSLPNPSKSLGNTTKNPETLKSGFINPDLANSSVSKLFRNVPLRTQQIMSPWSVVVSSASGSGGRREAGA